MPEELQGWRDRQFDKIQKRLHAKVPQAIYDIFEESFHHLKNSHLN